MKPIIIILALIIGSDAFADPPVIFGEGVISTNTDDFGGTFTPDGNTVFFTKSVLRSYIYVICYSELKNGKWQEPKVAPFSGQYRDFDPVISPDGTKMVFTSNRPVHGEEKSDYDIWMVTKTGSGWSEPIHLDTTINSAYDEHFASISASGNIYFSSNRPGGLGGDGDADFYMSKLVDGHYPTVEHLKESSTPSYELDCFVAADESYLLMGVYGGKDGLGNYDINISEKVNGVWTASRNLGAPVNSSFRDYSPRVSPDGKYLYFSSERNEANVFTTYKELKKNLTSIKNGSSNIYFIELAPLITNH
jgi:Tol biopolymer transport system component